MQFPDILYQIAEVLPTDIEAYVAGGAVRDALSGRPIHDLDFVLSGDVLRIARRIADTIGAAYYPMDEERKIARLILIGASGQRTVLDFSAFRGSGLEADLRMRDFTINAMAVDIRNPQELLDPLGGYAHLKARTLLACSPTSIQDDPVRVLRGVRMAAAFNLRIVKETHATTLMVTHDVDEAVLLSDRIVMMTNGPAATIGEILDVDLPRPRDRLKLAENPAYHHLRGQVLEFLYQKHLKKAA